VVDDEAPVALVAKRTLERCGFEVLIAKDGLEAMELFRSHGQRVRCVLLDLIMPRMDGLETLRELRRLRSDTPVILSSGYSEEEVSSKFAQDKVEGLVEKPFRIEALIRKVQEVLKEGPG
jgi:two-component system cell cycle sensor histidine kinase/response regulator CckA